MKLLDLNVLLYVVNEDSPRHAAVFNWWNAAVNADERLGLPWVVLLGFLRISTHPRAFPRPLDPHDALATVDAWLSLENVRVVREQESHWQVLRALALETGTAGNLTTDAHLAALAIGHGAVLVSCDSDFGRFKGLRWLNPLN